MLAVLALWTGLCLSAARVLALSCSLFLESLFGAKSMAGDGCSDTAEDVGFSGYWTARFCTLTPSRAAE